MIESGDTVRIVFGEGKHLATARDAVGGNLGGLLDDITGTVAGQARVYEIEDNDSELENDGLSDEAKRAIAITAAASLVVGVAGTIVFLKNKDRVSRLWNRGTRSLKSRLGFSKAEDTAAPEEVTADMIVHDPEALSAEIEKAFAPDRTAMTGEEVERRLASILLKAADIAHEMRALSNAEVVGVNRAELEASIARLTPQTVTEGINRALEQNKELLDDEQREKLMQVFGGGQFISDTYEPLKNERVRDALRLTDGDDDAAPALV